MQLCIVQKRICSTNLCASPPVSVQSVLYGQIIDTHIFELLPSISICRTFKMKRLEYKGPCWCVQMHVLTKRCEYFLHLPFLDAFYKIFDFFFVCVTLCGLLTLMSVDLHLM